MLKYVCKAVKHYHESKILSGFGEGRENVDDDERSGSPQTSRTAENIEKFSAAGRKTYNDGVKMKATVLPHPS
ncbi:hypothetical protein TNCV_4767801 [Trichonephila clavipes]|nr:hypothetical protein TNCV_4767801 [Trichonephila clavipes]